MSTQLFGVASIIGLAILCLAMHFWRDRIASWLERQDSHMAARAEANRRARMLDEVAQAERDRVREIAAHVLASQPTGHRGRPRRISLRCAAIVPKGEEP